MSAMQHPIATWVLVVGVTFVLGCQEKSHQGGQPDRAVSLTSFASDRNRAEATDTGEVTMALDAASSSQRYLFVYAWKTDDERTQAMRKTFRAFIGDVAGRADCVELSVAAGTDKSFVDKYCLSRAPMPLVLAFAPNGAITNAFPQQFSRDDLTAGFVSNGTANCMKLLQDGKLVVLCVQNARTQANEAALAGVEEFCRDERYRSAMEVITIDPADTAEAPFLNDLQISSNTSIAITVLLAPPGSPIAKFEGATTMDAFLEAITKASSGCCPGGQCGPDGSGLR